MAKKATPLIFCVVLFSSCAYGPKTEKKSPLNALNGENYVTSAEGGTMGTTLNSGGVALPIAMKRKDRATEVQGKVMMQAGLGAVPVQGVEIGLFAEDGKMLANGSSGIGGEFTLRVPVRNGVYKLKTIGDKYEGQYPVAVQSYSVTGILFQVQKKD